MTLLQLSLKIYTLKYLKADSNFDYKKANTVLWNVNKVTGNILSIQFKIVHILDLLHNIIALVSQKFIYTKLTVILHSVWSILEIDVATFRSL